MYAPDKFKEEALKRGYARADTIEIYLKNNPKKLYTEEDLEECYRFENREPVRNKQIKTYVDDEEWVKQYLEELRY